MKILVQHRKSQHLFSIPAVIGKSGALNISVILHLVTATFIILIGMRGSHRQFKNPNKPGTVTVAGKPSLDVPPGTLSSILKQAGLNKREAGER